MELVDHQAFPLWAASVVLKKGGKEKEKERIILNLGLELFSYPKRFFT